MKHWETIILNNLSYKEAVVNAKRYSYDADPKLSFYMTRPEWDGVHFFINNDYFILTKDNAIIINPREVHHNTSKDWMIVNINDNARLIIDNFIQKHNIKIHRRNDTMIEASTKDNSLNINKTRGFEFISAKQINKDFAEFTFEEDEFPAFNLPKRATKLSAGYDCYSPISFTLTPGNEIKIPTGIRSYMQEGEVLMAFPRSGLGFKYYCRLANTIGVIDTDYYFSDNEGHIFIKIKNEGSKPFHIEQGEAFCQLIFMPFLLADGDSFENGADRNGGFGSTTK